MQLKRLRLANVCQFESADVSFMAGMNGIVGRNGHGKSNLINMLYAGLSGDFSVNAGNKDLNIHGPVRDDKKVHSCIDIDFTVGGSDVLVHRNLRGSRSYMTINGGEPLYGDNVVTDRVCELLDADLSLMADHVFVRQGEIYRGVFGGRESERLKALQQLFQLEAASTCYKELTAVLTSLPTPVAAADIQSVDIRMVQLEQDISRVQQEIDTLPNPDMLAQDISIDRKVLSDAQTAIELGNKLAKQERSVAETANAAALADDAVTSFGPLQDAATIQVTIAELNANLLLWDRYDDYTEQLRAYNARVAALSGDTPEPVCGEASTCKELDALLSACSTAVEDSVLRHFADGKDTCPTCARAVDASFQATLDALQAAADVKRAEAAKLRTRLATRKAYDTKVLLWTTEEQRRKRELAALTQQGPPAVVAQPGGDPDEMYAQLEAAKAAKANADTQAAAYAKLVAAQTKARAAAEYAISALETTSAEFSALTVPDAVDVKRAEENIAQHDATLALYSNLQGQLSAFRNQLRAAQLERTGLVTAIARNKIRDAQHTHLSALRDCVHPQMLPRMFTQRYMHELAEDVNKLLQLFQVQFTVGIDDGLNMYVNHVNGTMDSVQRLSGGQKVVLALGFRVAVYRRFARHVGLLVLDEPTEYLDKENVNCLLLALDKLRQMADSEAMQCLVITHETRLQGTFDHVIALSGPGKI